MLSSSRKKLWIKAHGLKLTQNPYTLVVMKDLIDENSVSTSRKKLLSLAGISAKIQENAFKEQE